MADYGIRMSADASGLVGATEKSAAAQEKLADQLRKTTAASKEQNEESAKFVQRLKEQADTLGMSKSQVERFRAETMQLTDAQKASAKSSLDQIDAWERGATIGKAAAAAIAALTAAVVAYGVATAVGVKNVIDQAAGMHNLSQSLAISTQGLSAYQYQMSLAGVSEREFETGMRALAGRMTEAHQGVGKGEEVFRALGISVHDAGGRVKSLERIMPEITERFATYRDGVQKTTLAGEIFGTKVGERIIPMLNQGSEGFRAAAKEAEDFGRIIGPDMAKQADDFNSNVARINAMFMATKYAIANYALPAINDFMERLIAAGKAKGNFIDKVLAGWGEKGDADAETRAWQRQMDAQNAAVAAAFGRDAPSTSKADNSYTKAIEQLRSLVELQNLEAAAGEKVTQSQRLALQMQPLLNELAAKGLETKYMEVDALLAAARANEVSAQARERNRRAAEEATRALNAGVEQQWKSIASLEEHNEKVAQHNREIGMTKSQIDLLKAARAQETLAIAQQNLALTNMKDASDAELALAQARVKAAEDLVRLLKDGSAREAAAEGAKQAADEWKRASESIERSLTDALMRGFDRGKDFAENMRDALVNMFKTLVLEPIIRPVAQTGASMVLGAFGVPGAGSGGMGGMGGFGQLASSAYSLSSNGGLLGSLFSGGGYAAATEAAAVGGMATGAFDVAGMGLASSGAMGAIGTALPWVGGALAIASMLGLFGGGGGPKASQIWLQGAPGGSFNIGMNDVPGGPGGNLAQLNAMLADVSQYDPDILSTLSYQTITGGAGEGWDSMVQKLLAQLAPAAQSAQTKNASNQALLARLQGGGVLTSSLQGWIDSQAVSQYLSPEDRLAGAQGLFDSALARAGAGDADAARALPGLADQLLGAGRENFASGAQFQSLRASVNDQLARVLEEQGQTQASLLADLPISIRQAASDTVAAIDRMRKDTIAALDRMNSRFNELTMQGN